MVFRGRLLQLLVSTAVVGKTALLVQLPSKRQVFARVQYLFTHGDPVNGTDPTGLWNTTSVMVGLGISVAIGAIVGYSLRGGRGASAGVGFGAVAFSLIALGPVGWLGLPILALLGAGLLKWDAENWGIKKATSPKKVSVITGELGFFPS